MLSHGNIIINFHYVKRRIDTVKNGIGKGTTL
jgi:hypothetical protein